MEEAVTVSADPFFSWRLDGSTAGQGRSGGTQIRTRAVVGTMCLLPFVLPVIRNAFGARVVGGGSGDSANCRDPFTHIERTVRVETILMPPLSEPV